MFGIFDDDDDDDDECLYVYADSCRKSSLPESGMRRQVFLPRVAGSHASKTLRGAQRDDDDQHDNYDRHDADAQRDDDDQHGTDEGAEINVQKNAA